TVVAEQPGANCTTGGQAIEIGYDKDRDGTLEQSEISHTTYVCNPANKIVHDGDLTISGQADAYLLIGVQRIRGTLYIDAPTVTSLDTSALVQVDNGIQVNVFGGSSMSFPALTVSKVFDSEFSKFSLSLPVLQQVDKLVATAPSFSADSLTSVANSMILTGVQTDITLPALQQAAYLDVESDGSLHMFSAPQAASIGDLWMYGMNGSFPSLSTTNDIWLQAGADSFSAPAITSQYWIELDDTAFTALPVDPANVYQYYLGNNPSLTVSSSQSSLDTLDVYGAVTLDFPSLTTVQSLSFEETALTQISMPTITSVGTLQIQDNTALTQLSFPALTSVADAYIQRNAMLPTCEATAITSMATDDEAHDGNDDNATCPI
ncbi:MAG TPA: hypothetical protein VGC41_17520, partial [Kofleriaceae bacterium]